MTSADQGAAFADYGLLCPVWAGSPVAVETSDPAVLRGILDAEVGLAAGQAQLGLIPSPTANVIRDVASTFTIDLPDVAGHARGGGNPVIPVLAALRAAVALADQDAADHLHYGATSQDILDTAMMLVARRSLRIVVRDLRASVDALIRLADQNRRSAMAARTLTQHSVPTTFGLKAAGWLIGLVDAAAALEHAGVSLPVQLGGAAGTLASFTQIAQNAQAPGAELSLVDAFARELDLRSPRFPWHTHRAPVTDLGDALVGVGDALGKIAADIAMLSRTEIAELREVGGAGTGGSSAMPQKHNPVLSVLINSAARTAPGLAAELHRSAIAVDERPDGAWHAEWQTLRELLRQVGGAAALAAELLPALAVDADRMRENLAITGPLIVSERVMLQAGPVLGRDRVKQLVRQAAERPDTLYDMLRAALPDWTDERVRQLLDPENYLGANDHLIDRAVNHARGRS
ncbi:MAG: lyase family protein [Microbacteriaceae bacterium]